MIAGSVRARKVSGARTSPRSCGGISRQQSGDAAADCPSAPPVSVVQQVDRGEDPQHAEDDGEAAGGCQQEAQPGAETGTARLAEVAARQVFAGKGAKEGAEHHSR